MKPFTKLLASLTRPVLYTALLLSLLGSAVFVTPARAATFTVTKTADTNDGTCDADCSLREAISAANASPGPDTITIPAGTYQLTLANAGGTNEDNNATGDLDVLDSLTINGAGSGSTIIEAGTNTSNGIDKVFALNPICDHVVNVTITGVTISFGRNTQPSGAADFSFTGGGVDWCGFGTGNFTLSNSVISNNTNVNGYGGGLNLDAASAYSGTVNISGVTFDHNQTNGATGGTSTGGAVNIFESHTVTISNSTFTNNQTLPGTSGGGAIYYRPTQAGSLTISGSTFSSNTAGGIGGAIATATTVAGSTVSITNSIFDGNTATNSFGGALDLDSTAATTTPFSLSHLTITGNTAGISGGGVYVGNSNVTMANSLIVGNSAPSGSGIHKSVDASTATVTNNWWGCSTGPGATPCDTATTSGGTLNFTPWFRNQLTATTSPIVTNQSSSLTASFLTNSANTAVPVADLAEIIGRSVTWAAIHGNLSSTEATIQAAGTATGSFQATSAGTAVISAQVDNDNTSPVSSNVLSLTVNKADTTTAITNGASLSSTDSVTGQSVTVTYTVTGAAGNSPTAPGGNVTVSDGTNSCIASAAAGSCNVVFASAGAKTLTATYAGDANFNGSTSAGVAHTVNKADTTTTITSDTPDPSVVGQSVTFHYTLVANAPGSGTPTGNVTVTDGGSNSCTALVSAGSCTITFTSPGSFSLTASYVGDANYNSSASSPATSHTVNQADTTTTITLDTPDPSVVGQSVAFNFSVVAKAPGAGTPTGNVTVSDGGSNSCTVSVSTGTCNIAFTSAGSFSITATYAGDSNFNGSASSPATSHTVNKASTTTTITSNTPNPSTTVQAVTVNFTVTANAPGAGTPSGNVTVSDGVDSCPGTVAGGSCNIILTTSGARTLTASYTGDGNFNASTSTGVSQTVNVANVAPTVTTNPSDQLVNAGQTASFTAAASGSPAPTVQWQVSTDSGTTWNDIPGATSTTLSFTAAQADNGNQYRAVFTNIVNSATSTAATLTISTAPTVTTNPSSQTVTAGNTATFTAAASGNPAPTVQWQVSTDGGATFNNISGATSTTLSFTATQADNGKQYRAVFTNMAGTATTTAATLTVNTAPLVTTNPVNQTVNAGQTASFTAAASGNPIPTAQWQVSTDGGATFNNISGATSTTLSFTTAAGDDGKQYRALFTNVAGSATTTAATLTVNSAPAITTQPTNQSVLAGNTATFTAAASGNPAPTFQWQVSTDGGATFNNISGATATTLSFTATQTNNGNQYRAVFTNIVGAATTTAATLTVNTGPVVTTNPTSQTVNAGQSVSFSAAATGIPAPTVQWQVSTDGGATFNNIPGATATTLSFNTAAGDDGKQYRAVFTNAAGTATSNAATLTVNTAPVVTTQPTNQNVLAGNNATFTAAATGKPNPTVQWQVSTDGGATFNNISGATSTTLSFTAVQSNNGNQYRAVFTNSVGSATSNAATLSVGIPPTVTTNPSNLSVSSGQTASFSAAASGSPTPTVQWQVSTDGGATFNNISGATSTTLSFTASVTQNGNQYRAVFTNPAGTATSTAATLTVRAATSLLYNGDQLVNIGSNFVPAALLSSAVPACVSGQQVKFSLDVNPTTGVAGIYPLGNATTNVSGQATMSAVNTTGWQQGVYNIKVDFAGTTICDPSSTSAPLTVAQPGNIAFGGGYYTLPSSGRVEFGFAVGKTNSQCTVNCTYKGQMLLEVDGKWMLKGQLSSYSKLGSGKGISSGVGALYWWKASLNNGHGGWVLAASAVNFTINYYDSNKPPKSSTDSFGITIQYTPISPQPTILPNSGLITLKSGNIVVK